MDRIIPIQKKENIPEGFRETPVSDLLLCHNSGIPHKSHTQTELLIGMCMDHRIKLKIPENFAYVIRAGGADLRRSEFNVSYAVAVGGVRWIALIGHTQCGMSNLAARKDRFLEGLSERGGWDSKKAEEHFVKDSPSFEIGDEIDFVLSQAHHLSIRYPRVKIAPLLYKIEDGLLYWIKR